jgi:hypothetical protein
VVVGGLGVVVTGGGIIALSFGGGTLHLVNMRTAAIATIATAEAPSAKSHHISGGGGGGGVGGEHCGSFMA